MASLATYHNHTSWSDGKAPLADMVAAARSFGIAELGVSDHFVLHPEGKRYAWSMPIERLDEYLAELEDARRAAPDLVRVGLEVDWFPGYADALRDALAGRRFDYLIGSVHEVDGTVIDGSPRVWEAMSPARCDEVHRRYWVLMRGLAESGLFDVAAHLDLPKKFDYHPTVSPEAEIDAALPTLDLLRRCRARDIPVTLSADAHRPDHLLRDFDRGADRLRDAGYDRIARFADRTARFEPL
ncbi:MAG: PHP domain-containing protein [Planctomycetota bacterium]|jgi:histidinol-phosphatase (PHP family)